MTDTPRVSALSPGARCAAHGRPATGVCGRCGDYLCGGCGRRVDERLFCGACAQRLTAEHSRRSVYALVFGMLAAVGVIVLAPVALAVAGVELRAIRDGEAPLGGRGLARAGMAFAGWALVMTASAAALWIGSR